MTAQILGLNTLDDEDEGFQNFLETLKSGNTNAIFFVEKEDGTVSVGCTYTDRRDLVFALYRIQNLAQGIVNGGGND